MKKTQHRFTRLNLAAFALFGVMPCMQAQYLRIGAAGHQKNYPLSENPKIYVSPDGITVSAGDREEHFDFSQTGRIDFMQGTPVPSGINVIEAPATLVSREGDMFSFSEAATARIFTLSGTMLVEAAVSPGRPLCVSSLEPGLYMIAVTANNNKPTTLKFRKQ